MQRQIEMHSSSTASCVRHLMLLCQMMLLLPRLLSRLVLISPGRLVVSRLCSHSDSEYAGAMMLHMLLRDDIAVDAADSVVARDRRLSTRGATSRNMRALGEAQAVICNRVRNLADSGCHGERCRCNARKEEDDSMYETTAASRDSGSTELCGCNESARLWRVEHKSR